METLPAKRLPGLLVTLGATLTLAWAGWLGWLAVTGVGALLRMAWP